MICFEADSSFICFGSVFLRFLPEFQRVYGMYWECSETAIAYLEKVFMLIYLK
jgi:hypothetical protein